MKCRAVILPDGNVRLFVDEGSFEQASGTLRRLLAAAGPLAEVGEIERHRHGPDEQVVRLQDGAHVHV